MNDLSSLLQCCSREDFTLQFFQVWQCYWCLCWFLNRWNCLRSLNCGYNLWCGSKDTSGAVTVCLMVVLPSYIIRPNGFAVLPSWKKVELAPRLLNLFIFGICSRSDSLKKKTEKLKRPMTTIWGSATVSENRLGRPNKCFKQSSISGLMCVSRSSTRLLLFFYPSRTTKMEFKPRTRSFLANPV